MSYVVNWRGSDGQAGWHPVSDLHEAAAHVEHLRNSEGVGETKIFQLEEVAFEFKQYFRVELAPPVAEEPRRPSRRAEAAPAVVEAPAEAPAWRSSPRGPPTPAVEPPSRRPLRRPTPCSPRSGPTTAPANGQRRGLFGR